MVQKINGYTADYVKRMAKSIKKDQGIIHSRALDQAAISCGFHSWKHFINLLKKASSTPPKVNKANTNIEETSHKEISVKVNPYRNLLIAGINELIKNNKISLHVDSKSNKQSSDGYLMAELFGFNSVIIWRDIGYQELSIAVWWKYDHSLHPQANLKGNQRENFNGSKPLAPERHFKKFLGAAIHGWLERESGKYIMGKGNERIIREYVRRGEKAELEKLPGVKPNGYQAEGKFIF